MKHDPDRVGINSARGYVQTSSVSIQDSNMKSKKSNALQVSARDASARGNTNKKLDGVELWKQFEDLAVPRLELTVHERAAYAHLLRHTRLEGRTRLCFSIAWLARGARLTKRAASRAVRSLVAKGALRLAERSKAGHAIVVRLPEEIRAVRNWKPARGGAAQPCSAVSLEKADFLQTAALREAIHGRERGHCFYCLRRLKPKTRCLDHVVPQVEMGDNSYRNLVSSCMECNSQKGRRRAEDVLRGLYREGRLATAELNGRLRALQALAAGKLRPRLAGQNDAA
jgi:hypothetical protein